MWMFEGLLGKKVRIVQTDGYAKFGLLEREDDSFVILRFDDGRQDYINKTQIVSIGGV